MAEEPAIVRWITPLACWLSSAPVHFSVGLGHGLQVSARLQLPNKRRKVCRGDVSNAAVNLTPEAALPEQAGGLAGELQKRIEAHGDVRGQLERGAEPIDPDFYARWLKSKGSLDEAEMCIRAHAAWREAFVTRGRIMEDEIPRELAAKKAFLQGCDREGHPVLVVWAARHNMGDRSIEETKRFICYCLDNTIAAADFSRNPRGQILCLFDLSGLRTRNLDVKALQAVFELLQSHYPERLHALWFLNAPFIFWGVWRMVRPFIRTEETKSKIVFLSGSGRETALRESIAAEVLPEVYGGDAEMVPVEEAALKHLMEQQQQRMQSKQAAKRKASTVEAVKSSRIASAGRVLSRWSSSAWSVAKKPAVAAWGHLPHWQHMPRMRFRHSTKASGPSRTSTLTRTLSRHFSLRRPAFSMRQRPRRPSEGAKGSRPLLRQMLSPLFLIEVFRLLTISAAQALYYVWSHAVPLRLQRPRGDLHRLPSAAPDAATVSLSSMTEDVLSSSSGVPAESIVVTDASAACSSGSGREEKSTFVCESTPGAISSSNVQIEEHPSRAAMVAAPSSTAAPDCTEESLLQQQGHFLLLLAAVLLVGLVMLLPEFVAYLGRLQSNTTLTSTLI